MTERERLNILVLSLDPGADTTMMDEELINDLELISNVFRAKTINAALNVLTNIPLWAIIITDLTLFESKPEHEEVRDLVKSYTRNGGHTILALRDSANVVWFMLTVP